MQRSTGTRWRISPAAWVPIGLAIGAEGVSNGLRAYGLGTHLDRFTLTIKDTSVSLAGAVLVLAAVAVSLSQARAAWVALTPAWPVRQRIVAGIAAALLLTISVTAMASHILEAQRAKVSDEGGQRGRYERAKAAYDEAAGELAKLPPTRPVQVIQAEITSTKIDMAVWRRSQQCSDISRDDTKAACAPILDLYKERGIAARKLELAPKVDRLRSELAKLDRPEEASASETIVSWAWAWIMGLGVVFIATFGSVIYAHLVPEQAPATPVVVDLPPPAIPVPTVARGGSAFTRDQALADLQRLLDRGETIPSQDWLVERWGCAKGTTSRWLQGWELDGVIPVRTTAGRRKQLLKD